MCEAANGSGYTIIVDQVILYPNNPSILEWNGHQVLAAIMDYTSIVGFLGWLPPDTSRHLWLHYYCRVSWMTHGMVPRSWQPSWITPLYCRVSWMTPGLAHRSWQPSWITPLYWRVSWMTHGLAHRSWLTTSCACLSQTSMEIKPAPTRL